MQRIEARFKYSAKYYFKKKEIAANQDRCNLLIRSHFIDPFLTQ